MQENAMKSKKTWQRYKKIWPLIEYGQSDSACFDNALELLVMGGYSVAQAMMLLIPEAWQNSKLMSKEKEGLYQYYSFFRTLGRTCCCSFYRWKTNWSYFR